MYKVTLLLDANYRVVESHTEAVGGPLKVPSPPPPIVLQPNQAQMYEDLRVRSMLNASRTETLSFAEQYKTKVPRHEVWAKIEQERTAAASDGDWKVVQPRGHNGRHSRRG